MREHRPWGWFEDLLEAPGYKVKRLLVHSGRQLSLQRHRHRSESWTVVDGHGALFCGDQWYEARPGLMLTIPCGTIHRARAARQQDLVIMEVQHGDLLREDDIERLQDDYGRVLKCTSTFEA